MAASDKYQDRRRGLWTDQTRVKLLGGTMGDDAIGILEQQD